MKLFLIELILKLNNDNFCAEAKDDTAVKRSAIEKQVSPIS